MGKKLYFLGFKTIDKYINEKEEILSKILKNSVEYEYSRTFGKAFYQIKIKEFLNQFKLDKDKSYALKIFNLLSSFECINEFTKRTKLKKFLQNQLNTEKDKIHIINNFYVFIYLLLEDTSQSAEDIKDRIFKKYFLHYYFWVRADKGIQLNYQDMVKYLLKGKMANVKESYKEKDGKIYFSIFLNDEEIETLEGNSIKTLRKKAYKKLFFHILENQDILYTVSIK